MEEGKRNNKKTRQGFVSCEREKVEEGLVEQSETHLCGSPPDLRSRSDILV